MKRISVIVPVYNAEKHVKRCLMSIVRQLDVNKDEVLVIDDGSTDNSVEIIKAIQTKYAFIRIISKKNEGVAKTRNLGVKTAEGKYIFFVDNDDYLDSDYISTFYDEIVRSNMDIVIGGYRRTTYRKCLYEQKGISSEWYKLMTVAPWGRVYRREFLLLNDIHFLDYPIGEDIFFNFSAYQHTDKIKIISYTGYNWFYNESSISNSDQKGFKSNISICHLMNELFSITGDVEIYRLFYVRYVVWYLLFAGRYSSPEKFMKEYRKCRRWLVKKHINLYYPLSSGIIQGESLKNRMIVNIFIILCRLKMVPLFSKLYCKG